MFTKALSDLFRPNQVVSKKSMTILVITQLCVVLALWQAFPPSIFPPPLEILVGLKYLWLEEGLAQALMTSLWLNIQSMVIATLISLLIAYSWAIPFFRPFVTMVSKLRYWSLAGLILAFQVYTSGAYSMRLSLMVFAITVYYVTGMLAIMESVTKEDLDYARTMRMNEYQVVWEVRVLGKIDQAIDLMRQNNAMSWMMLTFVEGGTRALGGAGAMLLNQEKHLKLDRVFAIQFSILLLAIGIDYLLGWFRNLVCPYAAMEEKRS